MTVIRTTAVISDDHMLHLTLPDDAPTGPVEVELLITPEREQTPTSDELASAAQYGGSFDWLADEPDLYTSADGEPVCPPAQDWPAAILFSLLFRSPT
jgi:hypothetical protein